MPRDGTATDPRLGVLSLTTANIDRDILRAIRSAASKDRRTQVGVLCEAALEWLVKHEHALPEGYELVEEP